MLPNLITLSRLLFAAAFAVVAAVCGRSAPLSIGVTVALLVLAIFEETTDMLDGKVARRTGQVTQLGGLLDPLCDSLGRLTVYFAMALIGWLPLCVPLVMAGRDLIVSYTRVVQALTGGKTSARWSGKAKAIFQCAGIFLAILLAAFDTSQWHEWVQVGRWAVAALVVVPTLWSLIDYLRGASPGIRHMLQTPPAPPAD